MGCIMKLDEKRVALMTKLALYDQREGRQDRAKLEYFRHDYIYHRNMWTRFYVILGMAVIFVFYLLHRMTYQGIDIMSLDYGAEAIRLGVALLIVLGAYTIIGVIRGSVEYEKALARMNVYGEYLDELNELRSGGEPSDDEITDEPEIPDEPTIRLYRPKRMEIPDLPEVDITGLKTSENETQESDIND